MEETAIATKTEYFTIGDAGPAYEVLEETATGLTIKMLITGEVVSNYPLADHAKDPKA